MNILDYIILIVLLLSALTGFKKGLISSLISFVGTIIVIIVAYYLKSPVSMFLYSKLPFFSLGGKYAGISVVNILIYEAISYVLTIIVLSTIMGIIIKLSKALSKTLDSNDPQKLPSKILGALCGFIEGVFISCILVFLLGLVSPFSSLYGNSKFADTILEKTPILSSISAKTYKSMMEIYDVATNNENKENKEMANEDGLRILLKYEILEPKTALNLVDEGKINTPEAKDIIEEYMKGKKK